MLASSTSRRRLETAGKVVGQKGFHDRYRFFLNAAASLAMRPFEKEFLLGTSHLLLLTERSVMHLVVCLTYRYEV